jgi:hypothetical protein
LKPLNPLTKTLARKPAFFLSVATIRTVATFESN